MLHRPVTIRSPHTKKESIVCSSFLSYGNCIQMWKVLLPCQPGNSKLHLNIPQKRNIGWQRSGEGWKKCGSAWFVKPTSSVLPKLKFWIPEWLFQFEFERNVALLDSTNKPCQSILTSGFLSAELWKKCGAAWRNKPTLSALPEAKVLDSRVLIPEEERNVALLDSTNKPHQSILSSIFLSAKIWKKPGQPFLSFSVHPELRIPEC